jgi:predicted ABC-type sugar transport system permease subunit
MANGFLLMMELVPTEHQAKAGAGLMVAEGSTAIVWTIYFVYIGQSALPFLWFATFLNLITAILCMFSTESPRWLYCSQQFERCQ